MDVRRQDKGGAGLGQKFAFPRVGCLIKGMRVSTDVLLIPVGSMPKKGEPPCVQCRLMVTSAKPAPVEVITDLESAGKGSYEAFLAEADKRWAADPATQALKTRSVARRAGRGQTGRHNQRTKRESGHFFAPSLEEINLRL